MLRIGRPACRHARLSRLGALTSAVAALLVAGCTILTSERPDQVAADGRMPLGVYYALPKGLVNLVLLVDRASAIFHFDVTDPEFVPDPDHRYLMRYRPLPNYHDTFTVEVNDRAFIKKAHVTTKDETPTIIANIAKALGALGKFEAAILPSSGVDHLGTLTVDPTDPDAVARALRRLNRIARTYAEAALAHCGSGRGKDEEAGGGARCDRLARAAKGDPVVQLEITPPRPIVAGAPSDCTVGLCYRIKEPYIVSFSVGGRRFVKIIEVPNRAALVELDIRRAFLVQKIQNIDFDESGFLLKVDIHKPSELLAASELPLTVINAILDGMKIRVDLISEQRNLAQKQAAALQAQTKAMADARGQ
jgi:hypothetical protein